MKSFTQHFWVKWEGGAFSPGQNFWCPTHAALGCFGFAKGHCAPGGGADERDHSSNSPEGSDVLETMGGAIQNKLLTATHTNMFLSCSRVA